MLNIDKPARQEKKRAEAVRSFFDLGTAISQPFDPARILHDGFVRLSAGEAASLMEMCRYHRQVRDLTVGGRQHIHVLADIMRRGAWRTKDKLDSARLAGKFILLNGHHRLSGQSEAGVDIEWTVVVHDCPDERTVDDLYYTFDTNLRKRSNHNILAATRIAEEMGLMPMAAEALFRSIPLIEANFDFSVAARDPIVERVIDRRLERMRSFQREALAWDEAIGPAPASVKKKLRGQGAMAVGLMAFRHQPESAREFWSGVAGNDGLRVGDPRHAYLRLLIADFVGRGASTAEMPARSAATAWNAFFAGRSLRMIRPGDGILRIAGTPIGRQ